MFPIFKKVVYDKYRNDPAYVLLDFLDFMTLNRKDFKNFLKGRYKN